MFSLLTALLLVGCNRDKDEGGGQETSAPEPPPCDVSELTESWPEDGLSPASRSLQLSASFSGVASEEGVLITVTDADGAEVAGTTTLTDGLITWEAADLLAEDADYTWAVTVCDASGGGSFTTGAWGERMDPAELPDSSFQLDLSDATWISPEGGESLFSSLFDGILLLGVEAADEGSIDLIAAIGEEYEDEYGTFIQQSPCYATADFQPSDFRNNPYASVGPTTLSLSFEGITVPLQNVYVSGAFVGGTALADGTLSAELDMRDAEGSLGMDAEGLCDLLQTYVGLDCMACMEDGEELCVGLELEDITGTLVEGLRVVPNDDPQECSTDSTDR